VSDDKPTLLIVEDDLDIADMLSAYFRVQGYEALTVNWGEDAIRACQTDQPDLIILDIRLPDIDGFEVARRLKTNRRTQEIPIIFLTEKRERQDRLKGLELKAEDYITKPFDIQELRLRVRNSLRRSQQGSLTNTVTGLPEGNLVDERLRECMQTKGWAVLIVSLVNLNRFREVYGFVASDDLLRAVSLMLKDTLREVGNPNDFLGHFGPTDFIMVLDQDNLNTLKDRLHKRLDVSLDYFYRDQDRQANVFKDHKLGIRTTEYLSWQSSHQELGQFKAFLLQAVKGA
jgi:PleD family two-component response regulator